MRKMGLGTRLYLVCGFLIVCMVIISAVAVRGMHGQQVHTHHLLGVEIPAIRNMTLADMMHDGIRGEAYHSVILMHTGTKKEREESLAEFNRMAKDFEAELNILDGLEMNKETKAAIDAARPEVAKYIEQGRKLMEFTVAGKSAEAMESLGKFQESFESLEEKMETLGKLIEGDSSKESAQGDRDIQLNLLLTGFFVLVGSVFAFISVRSLLKSLRKQLKTLLEEQNGVHASATSVNGLAAQLTQSSTEQSSALDRTASSITQIDAMVRRNATDATTAKEISDRSAKVAQDGKHAMEEMLKAIDEMRGGNDHIAEQVNRTNHQIGEMIAKFQEIGQKTQVINDIVFQTRLLSFNASVEAARAGEHGKGFAVVAEEVGNLAQMSGEAAKEISHLLQTNTTWVNQVAEESKTQVATLLEETNRKFQRGTEVARNCERLLEEVVRNTQDVTERSNSIAVASTEQAEGVSEINKAVGILVNLNARNSQISQDAAGSADQLASSAGSLSSVVNGLSEVVNGEKNAA